jgi:hypothetical protein
MAGMRTLHGKQVSVWHAQVTGYFLKYRFLKYLHGAPGPAAKPGPDDRRRMPGLVCPAA